MNAHQRHRELQRIKEHKKLLESQIKKDMGKIPNANPARFAKLVELEGELIEILRDYYQQAVEAAQSQNPDYAQTLEAERQVMEKKHAERMSTYTKYAASPSPAEV